MKLLLMLAFPIYVVNVEVVLPAIREALFFQHSLAYLSLMNQLNVDAYYYYCYYYYNYYYNYRFFATSSN